ncbi:ArsR/SmtB family transcription factor [Desulfothermobacter acidiphilus]|uniref:ArsR/SmtB family transcription factor n=1 Tax=Desulfothermobacter acidiphilus TaxID=1938353 RepID=UPI003F8A1A4E
MEERRLELVAELLRALGHPLRLKILDFLGERERCVCEIIPAVGAEQSAVSKHLAVLRQVGILEARKEGLKVLYRVRDPAILNLYNLAQEFVACRLGELAKVAMSFQKPPEE